MNAAIADLALALSPNADLYAIRDLVQAVFCANASEHLPLRGHAQVVAGYLLCGADRKPRADYGSALAALDTMLADLRAGETATDALRSFQKNAH